MKTRKILLAAAFIAFLGNVQLFAQDTKDVNGKKNIDVNELIDKRCHRMETQLSLDEATAAKFAPIYREYLTEMRACHQRATNCINRGECTDAERISAMENGFDVRQRMLDTQKKYYNKFKGILNARQLETLFRHQRNHAGQNYKNYKRHNQCDKNRGHRNHANCDGYNHKACNYND